MSKVISPYYPPRARWYGRILHKLHKLSRILPLDKIRFAEDLSPLEFFLSLVLPGHGFIAAGKLRMGRLLQAGYAASVLMFFITIGYGFSNVCFGLMISIHAAGIIFLENIWLREREYYHRLGVAAGTLLILWLLIYLPLLNFMSEHWVTPLRDGDRVIVVSRSFRPESIRHGDRAAFTVEGGGSGAVRVRGGIVFGPVLAMGGDRVVFEKKTFKVNNAVSKRFPDMPTEGELIIPENTWFIWPELRIIAANAQPNQANITGALMQTALVSKERFVGRPFKRWFGRKQIVQRTS
jgi:hypothetical protein